MNHGAKHGKKWVYVCVCACVVVNDVPRTTPRGRSKRPYVSGFVSHVWQSTRSKPYMYALFCFLLYMYCHFSASLIPESPQHYPLETRVLFSLIQRTHVVVVHITKADLHAQKSKHDPLRLPSPPRLHLPPTETNNPYVPPLSLYQRTIFPVPPLASPPKDPPPTRV